MSANQIPGIFSHDHRKAPAHSCPDCWMNGGPGHTYGQLLALHRAAEARALARAGVVQLRRAS